MGMQESGAYGQRLGKSLRLDPAPAFATQTLQRTVIAVTHVKSDTPNHGLTRLIPSEDAYLAALQLADCNSRELWLDGRAVPTRPLVAGDIIFHDLRRNPIVNFCSTFHALAFYVPRVVFDSIAEDANAARITDLGYRPGVGVHDPTMFELARLLLPAFANPEQASRLFVDHVTLAAVAHIARTYGGLRIVSRHQRGGLAPWQERRAKELLNAHLNGDVSIHLLADECGLSRGHFSRAFRQSTGLSPHQWLMKRRVEVAQTLLADPSRPLLDVAQACGFSDQSHFTRVFARRTGVSPGAWRRGLKSTIISDGSMPASAFQRSQPWAGLLDDDRVSERNGPQ
jgi:AraC-like DNA-binding protein